MARWKRGVAGHGIRQALDYALSGTCDASTTPTGVQAATGYADGVVARFTATNEQIAEDRLNRDQLKDWIVGTDPLSRADRGRQNLSPEADLLLDATLNTPKSYSIAALLDPELNAALEDLQDRLRLRIIGAWQRELNARRGHAGAIRESLREIEVVELRHERSRALDPHKHRHLWLNVKVLGLDGRWSNLDTRVALRFQNVVNAEGDLAARTDPKWIAALAAKGFSLDADGEISELTHLVRPLSRRSKQIEANRKLRTTEWHEAHPGEEPAPKDLAAIDQWAWSFNRPNKPGRLNEAEWSLRVRSELEDLDPTVSLARPSVEIISPAMADLDRQLLAAMATVNADARATSTGGRFSLFDLRAGALRATAGTGIVAERAHLTEMVEDIVARSVSSHSTNLLDEEVTPPAHVKAFMANSTLQLKADVESMFRSLSHAGKVLQPGVVSRASERLLEPGRTLDVAQAEAAGAIAGTDAIVVVSGPPGTGKRTMLKVARGLLETQRRRCLIVAPTKKAATVAGQETGAASSSVHALLQDHGWIWGKNRAGREVWRQLKPGETPPGATRPYRGIRKYPLRTGDRIVVDEAGMLDLNAALALAAVARDTGARIAMVGDHLQVQPIGHSGAMALARMHATAVTELTNVQRFRHPDGSINHEYASLTLAIRDVRNEAGARAVAKALIAGGHVVQVDDAQDVRGEMAQRYLDAAAAGRPVSLVTSTNEEAQEINELVQLERLRRGELDTTRWTFAKDGQIVYEGDVIQTRSNDSIAGVSNRDTGKWPCLYETRCIELDHPIHRRRCSVRERREPARSALVPQRGGPRRSRSTHRANPGSCDR